MRLARSLGISILSAVLLFMVAATPAATTKRASKKTTSSRKASSKKAPAKKAPAKKSAQAKKTTSKKATSASRSRKTTTRRSSSRRRSSWRTAGQREPSGARLKEIQNALVEKGYFRGEPDGKWGPSSAEALKRFQEDQNIEATGKINSLSLIGLGLGPKYDHPAGSTDPPSAN